MLRDSGGVATSMRVTPADSRKKFLQLNPCSSEALSYAKEARLPRGLLAPEKGYLPPTNAAITITDSETDSEEVNETEGQSTQLADSARHIYSEPTKNPHQRGAAHSRSNVPIVSGTDSTSSVVACQSNQLHVPPKLREVIRAKKLL